MAYSDLSVLIMQLPSVHKKTNNLQEANLHTYGARLRWQTERSNFKKPVGVV